MSKKPYKKHKEEELANLSEDSAEENVAQKKIERGSNASSANRSEQTQVSPDEITEKLLAASQFPPDDEKTHVSDNVVLKEHLNKPDGLVGTIIADHFRIDSRLAEGGMSAVYRARDLSLGRDVAIKVLLPGRHFTEESLIRFQREAKAVGILNHPNIVNVYEMNTFAEGEPYIAMEFVDGQTLFQHVESTKGLPVDDVIDIMRQCAGALAYAHKQGIVHRDIKSGNIMLSRSAQGGWQPKLVDFGIARALEEDAINLTRTGEIFGSPRYMSPEQCRGEKTDARTDIYSLGCAFYEALTGDVPFRGATALDTMRMHNDDSPVPPSAVRKGLPLGAELDRIILKCLAKDRNHRYQSAEALEQELFTLARQKKSSLGSVVVGAVRKLPLSKKAGKAFGTKMFVAYFLISAALLIWVASSQAHRVFDYLWTDFNYKGQKAFDVGDYKVAEDHYLKALKIAETFPVKDKPIRLAFSLSELTELATATGNEEAHKNWAERRKKEAAVALGDLGTYRGQQIKLCNSSLDKFIADTKDPTASADREEMKLKAKQVLEKFNELSIMYDSAESTESIYAMMDRAIKATAPYLEKTHPDLAGAIVNRAWLAFFSNSDDIRRLVVNAEEELRASKDMVPSLKARNFSLLSQIYLALGDRDNSRRCSEESLSILRANSEMQTDTAVHALLVRALLEDETRHPDTADFFFNQAKFEMGKDERHSPSMIQRYVEIRLHLLSSRGATLHALQECKEILDEEEKHPTSRRLLARALNATGTLYGWLGGEKECIHLLERAHAVAQNNMEPALSAAALDMIGGVLGSHQKYNDAIPYFRRARDLYYEKRDIYPGSVVATSNNLALLLMKQGKYAEAIRVLEKAEPSANAPTFGAPKFKQVLYDRLAILSEKTGDKAAAERYRKKFNESLAR